MRTILRKLLYATLLITLNANAQDSSPFSGFAKISDTHSNFAGNIDDEARFGRSIAKIGDIDGNGVPDIAVGAFRSNGKDANSNGAEGAIWILFLSDDGNVIKSAKIGNEEGGFNGDLDTNDAFGESLAITSLSDVGDINNDGIPDLAVGASGDDDDGSGANGNAQGAVWILTLNRDGQVTGHKKIGNSTPGFEGSLGAINSFGHSLASMDVNRDGKHELIVGTPRDNSNGRGKGAVWVLSLNEDGEVESAMKIDSQSIGLETLRVDDHFGQSLATLDIDNDGIQELAVGAPDADTDGSNQGAVWILSFDEKGTPSVMNRISGRDSSGDKFGRSLTSLGDMNGDSTDDLFVGASEDAEKGSKSGAVWLLTLNRNGEVEGTTRKLVSDEGIGESDGTVAGDYLGISLANLGDINGDGQPELGVGADGDDDGGSNRGAIWILFSKTQTLPVDPITLSLETVDGEVLIPSIENGAVLDLGKLRSEDELAIHGATGIKFNIKAHASNAKSMQFVIGSDAVTGTKNSDNFDLWPAGVFFHKDFSFNGKRLSNGTYILETIAYEKENLEDIISSRKVTFRLINYEPVVQNVQFFDAESGLGAQADTLKRNPDIIYIDDSEKVYEINLANKQLTNVVADIEGTTGAVCFELFSGRYPLDSKRIHLRLEYIAPFSMFGDRFLPNGIEFVQREIPNGEYTLRVTPYWSVPLIDEPCFVDDPFDPQKLTRQTERKEATRKGMIRRIDIVGSRADAAALTRQDNLPREVPVHQAGYFQIELYANYPNPFASNTMLKYSVNESMPIRMVVMDILGREVVVLEDGYVNTGQHSIHFDAQNLASGIYLYRLETPTQTLFRKMIITR